MDKIIQSVQITFIGMTVVFLVLSLLAIILKIQGMIFAPTGEKKEEQAVKQKQTQETVQVSKTSPSNPKMAAAITAALAVYNEESDEKEEDN